jgi:hypothetical protein
LRDNSIVEWQYQRRTQRGEEPGKGLYDCFLNGLEHLDGE